MSTALQAYFLLENRGLIEARPQSGFYVKPQICSLPPEPAMTHPTPRATQVEVSDLMSKVLDAARDPRIVPLGAACPSCELFPTQRINRIVSSIVRRVGAQINTYDLPPGNQALRRQIARCSLDWGCSFSADDIIITCGCTEALNLCLRAVGKPGDVIAVETPSYFVILEMIERLGMKALEIGTHPRDGICLEELENAIERSNVKAAIVMSNFQNPLGAKIPDEKKEKLAALISRKGIPLIEDDIYGDLYFEGTRPNVVKAFDKKGLVLFCSSFSKTLAPGYRVGWAVPGIYYREVHRLKQVSSAGSGSLPQLMVAEFLQTGGYSHHLRKLRKTYMQNVQMMSEVISKAFPEETRMTRPQGGQVLWIELPPSVDSLVLHQKALQKNIGIAPGPIFSAKNSYRNFIRLNYGVLWSDQIEKAIITLGQLARGLA
jgi:DNA-binding transcriptional MocR family regulator